MNFFLMCNLTSKSYYFTAFTLGTIRNSTCINRDWIFMGACLHYFYSSVTSSGFRK